MIKFNGKKVSAKEAAQKVVLDRIFLALEFWFENESLNMEEDWHGEKPMTEKEKKDVEKQVRIIAARAMKPCGWNLNG